MLPFPINPRTAEYVISSSGGGAFVGSSPPSSPFVGQLWWDTVAGNLYIYWNDGDSLQWVPCFATAIGSSGGSSGAGVLVSATAPALPSDGDLWWDTVSGNLFLWYEDGDSNQWVPAFAPPGGIPATVSSTAPSDPVQGQLWWDDVAGNMYIWYNDGDSSQWVPAFSAAMAGAAAVGSAPPSSPVQGQQWFDSNSGSMFVYFNDGDSAQWVGVTAIG